MESAERSVRERVDIDYTIPFVCPDGSSKHIRIVGHPVVNAAGEVFELFGTAIDITEQHETRTALEQAFADLKKSEDQLREIINTIPTLAWSARPDGSGEFFNRRWLDYTGLSADQARDWGWKVTIHPDDVNALVDYWHPFWLPASRARSKHACATLTENIAGSSFVAVRCARNRGKSSGGTEQISILKTEDKLRKP
jgi:PAS domain-containing protein